MSETTAIVRERPILFSGPMVRAILDGNKVQTRRLLKENQHLQDARTYCPIDDGYQRFVWPTDSVDDEYKVKCPYEVGMHLWVREAFVPWGTEQLPFLYRADADEDGCIPYLVGNAGGFGGGVGHANIDRWKSPIHMPRWASRITLEITDVRCERLQEITDADAKAEGVFAAIESDKRIQDAAVYHALANGAHIVGALEYFRVVWNQINGKRATWESNPFVWTLTFRKI